jgi:acetyl-CoA acyltransferase
MKDAVIVSAARTAVGKAAGRNSQGHAARRARIGRRSRSVEARARASIPSEVEDVILGCAMPEAEQGMNVARIASLRAGIPSGARGHGEPLLFVRAAGDRLRRRAGDVRLRLDDRRRRHRVDEPGADGRPQDRAEPDADGQLSDVYLSTGLVAETTRAIGISRDEQDAFALRSHQRALAAIDSDRFAERSCRYRDLTRGSDRLRRRGGRTASQPRFADRRRAAPRHVAEALAKLRRLPCRHRSRGNSSQTSDGAPR